MTKILLALVFVMSLALPANALELSAPIVPDSGLPNMPSNTDSFGEGLFSLIRNGIRFLQPELQNALRIGAGIILTSMMLSILSLLTEKVSAAASIAGTVMLTAMMYQQTDGMIDCACATVFEICEYGKLLCPVLTTALAAQGGITASAALYSGTTAFVTTLSILVTKVIVPLVYIFLAFSVVRCGMGGEAMKKITDAIKNLLNWSLKTLLIIFTTYMSITGVLSGATDAAALKATKVAISTVVPVVGGILSDASESVLASMAVMKNTVGTYGILAVLAIFLEPFFKIGVQYLILKISSIVCVAFADKKFSALVDDFSTAMGFLLAIVSAGCVMVLISTVCFLKGIG